MARRRWLVATAALLALVAVVWWSARVPDGQVVRDGERVVLLGLVDVWTADPDGLGIHVSCDSWSDDGPRVTALEETSDEVRVEIAAAPPRSGPSPACLDPLHVPLAEPLGDRTVVDLSTGEPVAVWGRPGPG